MMAMENFEIGERVIVLEKERLSVATKINKSSFEPEEVKRYAGRTGYVSEKNNEVYIGVILDGETDRVLFYANEIEHYEDSTFEDIDDSVPFDLFEEVFS